MHSAFTWKTGEDPFIVSCVVTVKEMKLTIQQKKYMRT